MTDQEKRPAPLLALVVPCYNEEDALPVTAARLTEKLDGLTAAGLAAAGSFAILVDDGSRDGTWAVICALHAQDARFRGIKLSRNCGHQNALLAGLMTAKDLCEAAISLDADLQDDVDAMDDMLRQYADGCEIVYGVRSDRASDTAFKRSTAHGYYRLMGALGADLVYDHADYRLMSRRALEALAGYGEVNLFLRGIVPMLGFRTGEVRYARAARQQGESKYPLRKMLAFAFEGISSLSVKPIRLITWLGFAIFLVTIGMLAYILVRHFQGFTVDGWTFLAVSVWGLGGLQLLSIGIVGEYIGKIYLETKQRPRYHIETYLH